MIKNDNSITSKMGVDGNVFNYYSLYDGEIVEYCNPRDYLTPNRLDVIIRYLLIRSLENNGFGLGYASNLYREFLSCCNSDFKDGDGRKSSFSDYLLNIHQLSQSIKRNNYIEKYGVIPHVDGNIVDGAHRLAASLYYNCKIPTLKMKGDIQKYDAEFLLGLGLSYFNVQHIINEYLALDVNTFAVILYPCGNRYKSKLKEIIKSCAGHMIFEKSIELNSVKSLNNFVRLMYGFEEWWSDDLLGKFTEIRCQAKNNEAVVLFVKMPIGVDPRIIKESFRRKVGASDVFAPVHINDTHEETVRISRALLNDNALELLLYSENSIDPSFRLGKEFEQYKDDLNNSECNENFCIDSGAVLSLFGLRESNDLDYVSADGKPIGVENVTYDLHNKEYLKISYPINLSELIYDPHHYFYIDNVKFMSLKTVLQFKIQRAEYKDQVDVGIVLNRLTNISIERPEVPVISIKRKLKHKLVSWIRRILSDKQFNSIRLIYKKVISLR